jgi:hypothetical protein
MSMMKGLLCLFLLTCGALASQFSFSKALFVSDTISDTVVIKNLSNDTLVFDSIYSDTSIIPIDIRSNDRLYGQFLFWFYFSFNIFPKNEKLYPEDYTSLYFDGYVKDFQHSKIKIKPNDSISLTDLQCRKSRALIKGSSKPWEGLDTVFTKMVFVSGEDVDVLYVRTFCPIMRYLSVAPRRGSYKVSQTVGPPNRVDLLGRNVGGIKQTPAPGIYMYGKDKVLNAHKGVLSSTSVR